MLDPYLPSLPLGSSPGGPQKRTWRVALSGSASSRPARRRRSRSKTPVHIAVEGGDAPVEALRLLVHVLLLAAVAGADHGDREGAGREGDDLVHGEDEGRFDGRRSGSSSSSSSSSRRRKTVLPAVAVAVDGGDDARGGRGVQLRPDPDVDRHPMRAPLPPGHGPVVPHKVQGGFRDQTGSHQVVERGLGVERVASRQAEHPRVPRDHALWSRRPPPRGSVRVRRRRRRPARRGRPWRRPRRKGPGAGSRRPRRRRSRRRRPRWCPAASEGEEAEGKSAWVFFWWMGLVVSRLLFCERASEHDGAGARGVERKRVNRKGKEGGGGKKREEENSKRNERASGFERRTTTTTTTTTTKFDGRNPLLISLPTELDCFFFFRLERAYQHP